MTEQDKIELDAARWRFMLKVTVDGSPENMALMRVHDAAMADDDDELDDWIVADKMISDIDAAMKIMKENHD